MKIILKLTPIQNKIVYALQNGFVLVASSESKWIDCGKPFSEFEQFKFNSAIFWDLVNNGIIYQTDARQGHDYQLTDLGKNIITKAVKLKHINQ